MSISKEYVESVDNKDLLSVRLLLKNSLILDPSGKSFSEMLNYANEKLPDLFVDHDGESFKNKSEWDKDYFNEQTVKVVNNFSVERVELLKRIVRELYSEDECETKKTEKSGNVDDNHSDMSNSKKVGGVVAFVGGGLLISGLVIADTPIAVPIIGGVAIGVGAYLFLKK